MQNQLYSGLQPSNNTHANWEPPPSQPISYKQLNGSNNGTSPMEGETHPLAVPIPHRNAKSPPKSNNTHAYWGPSPSQPISYNQLNGSKNGASLMEGETHPLAVPVPHRNAKSKPKRNRRVLIFSSAASLFVLFGALFLVTQFISRSSHNVTLYQVNVQNVTQNVGGGGIVFPLQQLVLTYPESEQAVSVLVHAGDTVWPNQPLIQLDNKQLNIQIKQAADDVSAAQAYLNSVSASGSAVAIAQAQQQYDLAKNRYNSLVAQASSLTLHRGNLVAPMGGVVTEVDINPGQAFAANTPLLTIMDESSVIVHVKIPLADLNQVHIGQSAEVTPSALPNINLTGQVSSIIPQADPQTDTFEVWVKVPNADKNLLPGMSAFVRIQSSSRAFVVPRLAVLNTDRDSSVFVVRNEHAYLQRVHIIGRSISALYIDAGLSSHDDVVLVGSYQLHDGEQVHAVRVEKYISD